MTDSLEDPSDDQAPTTERDPVLELLDPESGPLVGGTRVKASGSGFAEGCAIEIDGVAIPAERISETELSFATPPRLHPGKAPVQVVVGPRKSEPAFFAFTKPEAPSIVSVVPSSGPMSGGTELVIAGLHFVDGAGVRFGDVRAKAVTFDASIQLRVSTPPRTEPGKVDVRIELPDGQSALLAEGFEYRRAAAPKIARIAPQRGPAIGGTEVVIEGTGFAPGCVVDVGGTIVKPAIEGDRLSFVTPRRTTGGAVYVSIANSDGPLDVWSEGFVYDEPRDPPELHEVQPRVGVSGEPARITLLGKAFSSSCRVEVGAVACTIEQASPAAIVALVPARGAVGAVDVLVTNEDGQSSALRDAFTWAPPAISLAVTSVTPARGPVVGGTKIVVSGAGFDERTTVQILDRRVAAAFVGGRLVLETPRAATAGPVDLVVTTGTGSSCTVVAGFTYEALELPVVTGVAPSRGPITGGTKVILDGTGFVPGTKVLVDRATRPLHVTIESATRVVVTMPPGEAAGLVDLRLVLPDGQSLVRPKAFLYERLPAPSIERWDPKFGSAAGGWTISVEGKNFAPGCVVIVGGTAAKTKRIDEKNIEASVAAFQASGFADVTVLNPDRQSATARNAIQVSRR
ncbi:MAG: IPT/TIG domain-containing protein [Polyangiales bacterium]